MLNTSSTQADHDGLPEERSLRDRQRLQAELLTDKEGLLQAVRPRLLRLAQLRGVAPDAIDDVVQETLLEAWKHLDRLQSVEGFHPWMDEICRNVCRRYARRQQTDLLRSVSLLDLDQFDAGESGEMEGTSITSLVDLDALDPIEALSRKDLTVLLNRALSALPGTARNAVELYYLSDLPQRDAAMRLGLSISALEGRLHRARRQLRQLLSGPLRAEAEALGLVLDNESATGWRQTRLWCNVCGRRHLQGTFEPWPGGSVSLHLRCPDCSERYGLSNAHSKGLVQLDGLRSFRPAWKRTMQELARRLTPALTQGWYPCLRCGTAASLEIVSADEQVPLIPGPYHFWVKMQCPHCGDAACASSADDLVYWSHPLAERFIMQHPRWISEPDSPIEFAGQPAIRFQMADMTSTERLTILAHRQTLQVLAIL